MSRCFHTQTVMSSCVGQLLLFHLYFDPRTAMLACADSLMSAQSRSKSHCQCLYVRSLLLEKKEYEMLRVQNQQSVTSLSQC